MKWNASEKKSKGNRKKPPFYSPSFFFLFKLSHALLFLFRLCLIKSERKNGPLLFYFVSFLLFFFNGPKWKEGKREKSKKKMKQNKRDKEALGRSPHVPVSLSSFIQLNKACVLSFFSSLPLLNWIERERRKRNGIKWTLGIRRKNTREGMNGWLLSSKCKGKSPKERDKIEQKTKWKIWKEVTIKNHDWKE